jgi:RNA polymerase sigma-70 factor, ECF subfamily
MTTSPDSRTLPVSDADLLSQIERTVRRQCPPWLASQVDDLVQVTIMRVMEVQKKDEGNEKLSSSYVWGVAHNAMIDEIRRQRRRREVSTDEEGQECSLPATSGDPEGALRSRQIGLGIRACLEHIMTSRRLPLTLYLQGMTVPESAKVLGWSVKKVENLVYRGLAELRGCLEKKGFKP